MNKVVQLFVLTAFCGRSISVKNDASAKQRIIVSTDIGGTDYDDH